MKVNNVQLDTDGAYRSVKSWFLLRRIELAHRRVVLWESFAKWVPTGSPTSSPVEVLTSSWATADPIPELGENGSFLQIAVSVRARGAAGGSSSKRTPELSAILHLYEHFVSRRSRLVANLLTDLSLKA